MSDLDIAIYTKKELDLLTQGEIIAALECAFDTKVDLIILNDLYKTNPKLAFNITDNHQVVFCNDEKYYIDFKTQSLKYYFDIAPMYEMFDKALKERLENGTYGKLRQLEENVKILTDIHNSVSIEDVQSNKRYEWEIRYGLFESIQIIIDILCKITSTYNLGNPKNYKECVKLLAKHNYLSEELSEKVISMVGLRNLLVHEYVQIDNKKLYNYLNFIDDFITFAEEIQKNTK